MKYLDKLTLIKGGGRREGDWERREGFSFLFECLILRREN